jgi:peptidoglycan hydrolase CwlO-like protein
MNVYTQVLLTILASAFSGLIAAIISVRKNKAEKAVRDSERAHDLLIIEIKDLQIKLYKLEKDLNEWKEKYFEALQELIQVKSELEGTMLKLTHIELHGEG